MSTEKKIIYNARNKTAEFIAELLEELHESGAGTIPVPIILLTIQGVVGRILRQTLDVTLEQVRESSVLTDEEKEEMEHKLIAVCVHDSLETLNASLPIDMQPEMVPAKSAETVEAFFRHLRNEGDGEFGSH